MAPSGLQRTSRKVAGVLATKVLLISSFLSPLALPWEAPAVNLPHTNYALFRTPPPDRIYAAKLGQVGGNLVSAEYHPPPPIIVAAPSKRPETGGGLNSDNQYKLFIYNKESGNDPKRWNSEGCLGLGQSCPSSKLLAVCPNLDYGCEDQFFTDYANHRYQGWKGAYEYWLVHHNW
jgi:hypothetical protein